jgi:archaemetzincin
MEPREAGRGTHGGSARTVNGVELVPLGTLPAECAGALAAALSRELAVPCRLAPGDPRGGRLLPGRQQADADALLEALESRAGPERVVLGVSAQDLGIAIFTFVFGRARAGGNAALIALARLDPAFYGLPPDEGLLMRRAVREALHELAHVAGLPHCERAQCLMRFAGSVEKADLRGTDFCEDCASRLPEWIGARRPGRPV